MKKYVIFICFKQFNIFNFFFFIKDVFSIPSELSYESAVSIGDSYATALIGLARRANLKKDQTILVTAAAGGLGLAAVDIAANMCKAKVSLMIFIKIK